MSNTMYTCMCMCIECMQLLHHKARRCYYSYIYCLTNIVLTCLMHSYAYILIYHLCTASLNCTLRLYMYSAFACLLVKQEFHSQDRAWCTIRSSLTFASWGRQEPGPLLYWQSACLLLAKKTLFIPGIYWPKGVLCSGWLCITSRPIVKGDVVCWFFMHKMKEFSSQDPWFHELGIKECGSGTRPM